MSVANFCRLLHEARFGKNDKEWFPRWIRRYASSVNAGEGRLPVGQEEVISFLQSLLKSKTPAWQRLQAVRAIEAYRDLVLQTAVPSLTPIRQKLSQMADQERATGLGSGGPGVQDERHLIGRIDPAEPAIVQQMRRELRVRHKALDTERAYVGWVERFIRHCGSADLASFGEGEIKTFLTELAVEGNVTAGTQNQAKCALLFLFQRVLGRELAFLDVTRATKPERLPPARPHSPPTRRRRSAHPSSIRRPRAQPSHLTRLPRPARDTRFRRPPIRSSEGTPVAGAVGQPSAFRHDRSSCSPSSQSQVSTPASQSMLPEKPAQCAARKAIFTLSDAGR